MSEAGNDAAAVSSVDEQSDRNGASSWFSNREWVALLIALAVAVGGTAAAALTPDHSAAATAPTQAKTAAVTHAAPAPSTTATATAASLPATLTSVAATGTTSATSTVAAVTAGTTATTSSGTTTSSKRKTTEKTAAKKAERPTVPTAQASLSAGSELNFGTYAGTPLRWRVLDIDSSAILLVSKYVLSAGAFQSDWEGKNASVYGSSEVRTWLRGTFAPAAFNTTETASLLPHIGGAAAGERVFLLSAAEVGHYFPKAADRRAAPSAAAGNGAIGIDGEPLTLTGPYASWWLADAASDDYSAQVVRANGKLSTQLVYYADLGVRPAIRVARSHLRFTLEAAGD